MYIFNSINNILIIKIFKEFLIFFQCFAMHFLNYVLYKTKTRAAVVPIAILFCRYSPHCCSRLGYSYVPCHRAPLPSSDTSSSSAQLLYSYSRRPLHLLPLLVPHHSSSSSSTASVFVMCSTLRFLAISLSRLARALGPAFLSPGNCSNFDSRDTTRSVGMWTLRMRAPVSLT